MAKLALIRLFPAIAALLAVVQPLGAVTRDGHRLLVEVEILRYRGIGSPPIAPNEITTSVYTRLDLRVVRGLSRPTRLRRLTVTLTMAAVPQSNRLVLLLRDDRAASPEVISWAYVSEHTCMPSSIIDDNGLQDVLSSEYQDGDRTCGYF